MTTSTAAAAMTIHGLAQNADKPKKGVDPFTLSQHVQEIKYDGWRILANVDADGKVHLYTRTATDKTGFLPAIEEAIGATFPPDSWIDGEVCALTADGSQSWGSAQSVLGSGKAKAAARSHLATYVVFDCMAYGGMDIRQLPMEKRRQVLDQHLEDPYEEGGRVLLMASVQEEPSQALYDDYLARGYEGAMVKDKTARYASGSRGHGWIKLKANDTADVVVMGYKDGKDSFAGMVGAVEFGQYKDGELVYRGRCSGMTMAVRKDITANLAQYEGQVMEVKYMGIMPSGSLRHPQFKAWREDKPARECDWVD